MRMKNRGLLAVVVSALCVAFAGSAAQGQEVANFSLPEINTTSLRRAVTAEPISPRDYLHQVTAWYFASET
jgi:hypothetical protein